jgi:hypothetical protein
MQRSAEWCCLLMMVQFAVVLSRWAHCALYHHRNPAQFVCIQLGFKGLSGSPCVSCTCSVCEGIVAGIILRTHLLSLSGHS